MEFGRKFGIFRGISASVTEPTAEREVARWQEAFVGESFLGGNAYLASIARRDDRSKKINGFVRTSTQLGTRIDIPLIDEAASHEELFQKAYETSLFFDEIDPDRYRAFATAEFTRDHLVAFINKKVSGVTPDDVPEWFYKTFGLSHLERYGSVLIGSHGGRDSFNATIESASRSDRINDITTKSAVGFVGNVERSLSHISVEPFPIKDYLQAVQSTVKFRPKDWDWLPTS